jgi:hypothetical protein
LFARLLPQCQCRVRGRTTRTRAIDLVSGLGDVGKAVALQFREGTGGATTGKPGRGSQLVPEPAERQVDDRVDGVDLRLRCRRTAECLVQALTALGFLGMRVPEHCLDVSQPASL